MDVTDLVRGHYTRADLADDILAALAVAGVDTDNLTVADLAAVDQLHAGGLDATSYLLARLGSTRGSALLDIGCGIGGPSRVAAEAYGVHVTGVDLTPAFVEAATVLTARVGLGELATFAVTSGRELPFEDGSFAGAMMVHVGMNVPDKQAVFAEIHRVLAPGSTFALYEQVRRGGGSLTFPLPWAEDERSSFVETADAYLAALEGAGFVGVEVEDRTDSTSRPPPSGALSPMAVFGAAFAQRIGNNVAATRAGTLGAVLILATA
jgi:SAM-dependent methyltransferase